MESYRSVLYSGLDCELTTEGAFSLAPATLIRCCRWLGEMSESVVRVLSPCQVARYVVEVFRFLTIVHAPTSRHSNREGRAKMDAAQSAADRNRSFVEHLARAAHSGTAAPVAAGADVDFLANARIGSSACARRGVSGASGAEQSLLSDILDRARSVNHSVNISVAAKEAPIPFAANKSVTTPKSTLICKNG